MKLALIQMLVVGADRAGNLARAEARIGEAAASGVDLILLPEVMDLGWTDSSARAGAQSVPDGETCQQLAAAAKTHGVYICSGLTERDGDRVYNAAVIIGPDGSLLLRHRKLNELQIGFDCYDQGDRLGVCHTPLGTLGLMICADGFARGEVLSRALGYMGADIILSPCAWAMPADHDNDAEPYGTLWRRVYTVVAKTFAMPIVGCSNVGPMTSGPWAGYNGIGCSLVIDADGREVVQGPYGVAAETILYVDLALPPRPARGCGWGSFWHD